MKKSIVFFLLLGLLNISCNQTEKEQNPEQLPEKKVLEKEESALKYVMFKAENTNVEEVAQFFKSFLEEEGMYYPKFLDFQHAAQIDNIEFKMNPTVLVIFGNPKEMGVLIKENQEAAIDLPFRILIFQNETGEVWVMYKDFPAFKEQFFLEDKNGIIDKYDKVLRKFQKKLPEYLSKIKRSDQA